jgi:hypothetical protein
MQTFTHPSPTIDRISQIISFLGACLLLLALPLFLLLVLAGAPGGFLLVGVVAAVLSLPLLMRTAVAPALAINDDGLVLQPLIWRDVAVPWAAITAVTRFPLLPSEDAEVTRKIAVGRRNYNPADGIMLVIPALGWQYRIAGFFTGASGQPVIAVTNRAHTDYQALVKHILQYTDERIHDDELMQSS